MRLELYGIMATPPEVRLLFDQQLRPEGCWDWFEIVARTTLSGREKAKIIALVDSSGRAISAVPVVTLEDYVIRALTAPFTTIFCAPFGCDEAAKTLGKLLVREVGAELRIDALDNADSAATAFENGLASGGMAVARFKHFANWFEQINNFADYWNSRGSKLKSTVKRKTTALLRAGRLRFDQIDMVTNWQQGAEIYSKIYARSWKPVEPHPHFIEALLAKLGPRGIAKLGVATIDGIPVAAQIWLVQRHRATIFKLAHDPDFDRQSPGTLLTHWILHQLCENEGVRDIDFGRGDDIYKRQWLRFCRNRHGIVAASPRTLKGLIAVVFIVLPTKLAKYLRPKPGKTDTAFALLASRNVGEGKT